MLPPLLMFIGNLACRLGGSVIPFDEVTLQELYPNHGSYVRQVVQSVHRLKAQGLLLQEDAVKLKTEAAESAIGE